MGKNFEQYYHQHLFPVLQRLEEKRKHNKKITFRALTVIGLVFMAFSFLIASDIGALAAVITSIPVAFYSFFKVKPIKATFKNEVVANIVKYIDESLEYNPSGYIARGHFSRSLLFRNKIDRYRGDDLVRGTIDKTDLEFSEIHAEYKTTTRTKNGGTQTTWHTIFKGFFVIADFHKDFNYKTLILPNKTPSFFGSIGRTIQKWTAPVGTLVKLEDVEFAKYFVVYSEDQVEARYLISTAMMQRVLDYRKRWGKDIYFSLVDSKLYLAISQNKNQFEPTYFKSMLGIENYLEMKNYMNLIIDLVEDLNLNTRIWTKE